MIIYNGGRASGKTTKAIEYIKEHPGTVLFVRNEHLARDIRKNHDIEVITFYDLKNYTALSGRHNPIFIDGIEDFFDNELAGITTLGNIVQLKHTFKTPEQLRDMINMIGIDQFNKDFPEWSIG